MKATVTSKGQVTIPLPIRRRLALHKGTVLEFDEEADDLRVSKCADPDRMRSVIRHRGEGAGPQERRGMDGHAARAGATAAAQAAAMITACFPRLQVLVPA
jgi:AbrB family looped-hinge helix DNA binding protein